MKVSGLYIRCMYNSGFKDSWQWQPETYEHRFGAGLATDASKVPPMIVSTLETPPANEPAGYKNITLLGVG